MSFRGFNGGRGGGRGGGRYGGRGGGFGGGEGGGGFGVGGQISCPLCGLHHHPDQSCWPFCAYCGQRHHTSVVCEQMREQQQIQQQRQQRQQQQRQTSYAGGQPGTSRDHVLGLAQKHEAEIKALRETVDALRIRVTALETQVSAAAASRLAPRAGTQHGPTLAATQGVQTAGGSTGTKRSRDGDLEATSEIAPPKKRRQRGGQRQRRKDENAKRVKVEEDGEEDLADDVADATPPPNPRLLDVGDFVGSSLRSHPTLTRSGLTPTIATTVSPLPGANTAQSDALAGSHRRSPPVPLSTELARARAFEPAQTVNGIDFSEEGLLAAVRPAAGFLDEAFARRTAQQLASMPFYLQREYAIQAENNGMTPLAVVMRAFEAADAELQAVETALPRDDADVD